ncbi:hypothetical protein B0H19DRAFT_1003939 [Mycena capillaripes]|nr:hypothetical protein B0H19DRAFT_1003939 [Mycena capillaripes]
MPAFISLEYPITRTFPGRVFSSVTIIVAMVVLVILTVLNVALAGYETVTHFDSDFNVTQRLWYDRFIPFMAKSRPGSLCDPRLLGLGDTLTTNYTMFQYSIALIDTANAGDSGFAYEGWTLDNCDITSLYVNADGKTLLIDYTALVTCKADAAQILGGNDFQITVRTDWSLSFLAGKYVTLLGAQKASNNRMVARGSVLSAVMTMSSEEFAARVLTMFNLSNNTTPISLSFQVDFPWCPASLGRDAPCANQVPSFNITDMFELYGNGSFSSRSTPPNDDMSGIISNTVQTVYASVRLDLGNRSPNNFLLNTSRIADEIIQNFPQTYPAVGNIALPIESDLYSLLVNDGNSPNAALRNITGLFPLSAPGPAVLDGVYLCHFQHAKSRGSAFIAVLVATLSMFSSGWALFLGMAAFVVKKRAPNANACHGTLNYDPVTQGKELFMY